MKLNKFYLLLLLLIYLHFNSNGQIWKPVTTDEFYYPGNTAFVGAMVVDSATNTLIVGGKFDSIGSVPAINIARWDGINFTPIGTGLVIEVLSLAIYNNEIYATNGYSANNFKIYKWDGNSWSVFANPNDNVRCLKVYNGKLYAGGNFSVIDGVLLKGIGVYDGVSWSDIGGGVDDPGCGFCSWVEDIEFVDTMMYIGGAFATAGSTPVSNIAKWDGTTWSTLGTGVTGNSGIYDGWVFTIEDFNNELFVGGNFDSAGGVLCSQVAKWNGNNWAALGNGLTGMNGGLAGPVYDFAVFNNKLYSAAWCSYSDSTYIGTVANWNGIDWSITGNGLNNGNTICLAIYYNEIFAGGPMNLPYYGNSYNAISRFGGLEFQTQNSICGNNCNGIATITDSVGVPPHSYMWSNGATTKTVSGLCPGVYMVSVTDGGGSVTEGSVTIDGPPAIQVTATTTNVSCGTCNDGSIIIGVSGGIGALNILWSNGDTTNSLNNLSFGSYSVTVTDSMGCSFVDTYFVSYVNSIQTQSNDVNCYGVCTGSASIVSTGVAPLSYQWSNGVTADSAMNLCAGIYYATATDSNGVATIDTVVITEPAPLVSTGTSTNASCYTCNTGTATVISSGGSPPHTYEWNNGATTSTIDSLMEGVYSVTVTDSNGCVVFNTVSVGFDVGVNELQIEDFKLQIYPNPANETVTIEYQATTTTKAVITIENYLGQAIQTLQITTNQKQTINISNYPSGMYFIKCFDGKEMSVVKLVKQ